MAKTPVILLAAGSSSRLGQPKQLLPWGEKTLIEHQLNTLAETGEPVILVLGANAGQIRSSIQKTGAKIVVNHLWESGMASSIACGIMTLQNYYPDANGTLIALVDQPLVPLSHYMALLNTFQEGNRQIIASTSQEGWLGVPVIFDQCYFGELKNLQGEKGAKTLIQKYATQIKALECNAIIKDIDTWETYLEIHQKQFK